MSALTAALDIPKRILGSESNVDGDLLVRVFTWLRRNSPRKVVLCIDQFEQWLFTHASGMDGSSLADALRQCDGINLQAILMVRDDFWMGITRLMQALDLEISENHNASSVDLFTKTHARHVLTLFGQAYGQLPKLISSFSPRQNRFLDAAVDYLAVDNRVICVQLAIFAEMIKHRAWDDSSILKDDHRGGIGFQFLDQTFDATTAPRKYHVHAEGARRVLRCLMPSTGAKIKGSVRSEVSLREAAGYQDDKSFRALIRILDSELHLITPSDREEREEESHAAAEPAKDTGAGYQLTHDFLIAAVRYWLDKHQLETRSGQAQLRLEEFSELYRNRPTSQSLPTLAEFAAIRNRLSPKSWSESQRNMMRAARNHYAKVVSSWMMVIAAVLSGVLFAWHKLHEYQIYEIAQANVDRLLGAELSEAITQSVDFRNSGPMVQSLLQSRFDDPNTLVDKKARAILAMSHPTTATRQMLFEYPPIDSIVPGMRSPENYMDRTGYRLPSDAEWEFAARGGYELGRHFGFADELLNNYAWTARNSGFEGHPVGGLLSNDYGLFDILGNAMEWCQDPHEPNPSRGNGPSDDPAREIRIVEGGRHVNTRGAAMMFQPQDARAPHRNDHVATQNRIYLSFRIARTIR